MQGIEYKFENEAAEVANAIRHFAQNPEAIDNFESYISIHFDKWLEKWASTPGGFASELTHFSHIYDEMPF